MEFVVMRLREKGFLPLQPFDRDEMYEKERLSTIKSIALEAGADLIGVADLRRLSAIATYPRDLLSAYRSGISIAVNFDQFGDYDSSSEDVHAFPLLINIAKEVQSFLVGEDFRARVIVPDKRAGRIGQLRIRGEISHKAVAMAAGLGWMGKSMLLVTREFGPRVSLITLLTDMPLPAGKSIKNGCGSCVKCVGACPIGAISGTSFSPNTNEDVGALDILHCNKHVIETWRSGKLCYGCMLACPKGKR